MARMLEREHELRQIDEAIAAATHGSGALLVVEGPAGIGKSSLLRAARQRARAAGAAVLQAAGRELEHRYPFGVVLELFERSGAAAIQREAAQAIPLVALLGARRPTVEEAPHEFLLLRAFHRSLVALADDRPLAVVVDDVHWADEQSLRALLYVAERVRRLPVALVAAIRTGDRGETSALVARLRGATDRPSLRPAPLTVAATRTLLLSDAPALADSEPFVRASREVTGGNPFLLAGLLAAIRADPAGWREDDLARLRGFAPETVRRTIVVRLAGLGAGATELARALAVLGDASPLGRVASLAGLGSEEAATVAERLLDTEIVVCSERGTLSFAHPMLRAAVLDAQPPGTLAGAQLAAARILDADGGRPEHVAGHLLQAIPTTEPWARRALHAAGRAALQRGAPAAAVGYLRRAAAAAPPGRCDAAVLVDLGLAEAATGETTSLQRFTDALRAAEHPAQQERAMHALGQTQVRYGRGDEAARTFAKAAELFAERAPAVARRFRCAEILAGYVDAFDTADLHARVEAWIGSRVGQPPRDLEERALLGLLAADRAVTTPPAAAAAALVRDALGDGALLREDPWDGIAVLCALRGLIDCEAWSEALPVLDRVVEDAQRRGSRLALAEGLSVRARARLRAGRLPDAIADVRMALEAREHGFLLNPPVPEAVLARCLLLRGERDAAERVLRDVEPLALETPGGMRAFFHVARAELLLPADPAGALEELVGRAALPRATAALNPNYLQWRPLAAIAAHATGDTHLALRLLDEDIALSERFGVAVPLGVALQARGRLEGGERGLARVHQAVDVLEDADAPIELAAALLALGELRRATGTGDPREPLSRALDLAARCGATELERAVHGALLAAGARPRRTRTTGPDALTPSERRIAELAASGLNNPQIAATLVLTEHTVKWHLSRVYRKLGIASRRGLGEALATHTARGEMPSTAASTPHSPPPAPRNTVDTVR